MGQQGWQRLKVKIKLITIEQPTVDFSIRVNVFGEVVEGDVAVIRLFIHLSARQPTAGDSQNRLKLFYACLQIHPLT